MLTRELLRTRTAGKNIVPQFVKTDDPALLELAKDLIGVYAEGTGHTREYLDGLCDSCIAGQRDLKLARGVRKMVDDRAEFAPAEALEYAVLRRELFLHTAARIRAGSLPETSDSVRDEVFRDAPDSLRVLQGVRLYGDLPDSEQLTSFKAIYPREALERYNLALVQGLILYADSLETVFRNTEDRQNLRRLFKYLRFFRLLASAERSGDSILMKIDGPGSILENSAKYGLQLASFFPALCLLPVWTLDCVVRIRDKERRLKLDQSAGLKSHFSNYSAYQPEELRMFASYFQTHAPGWTLDDAPDFLELDAQKLVFPDFSFTSDATGLTYPLELFHRWHASVVTGRLDWCEHHPDCGLLLGVDRSLLKKDGVLKARLDSSTYFASHGFLFRDFPGVENVLALLEKR